MNTGIVVLERIGQGAGVIDNQHPVFIVEEHIAKYRFCCLLPCLTCDAFLTHKFPDSQRQSYCQQ